MKLDEVTMFICSHGHFLVFPGPSWLLALGDAYAAGVTTLHGTAFNFCVKCLMEKKKEHHDHPWLILHPCPVSHLTFSETGFPVAKFAEELVGFPNAKQFPDPGRIGPRALRSPKACGLLRIDAGEYPLGIAMWGKSIVYHWNQR